MQPNVKNKGRSEGKSSWARIAKLEARLSEEESSLARIAKLEARLKELSGGAFEYHMKDDCPVWIRETFLRRVLETEECKTTYTLFDILKEDGVPLPNPKGLDAQQVTTALWGVVEGLADRGTFLERTDHLSERELYERLWTEELRQEDCGAPPPRGSREGSSTMVIDILGGCIHPGFVVVGV